ncbi:A24 family peptidase [Tateyamaria omphalii]|uniref:prepilin peptidase n=1 Tax=Tateyamaria omphalii TaxID=299262 RepID=UPI001C998B7D|nr:A24 family peptidase [Tateyamaria omphalii]MBY5934922.1 A24 family peptidase [Tateyamaria omphalii]
MLGPWTGTILIWTIGGCLIWASVVDFIRFEIPNFATLGLTCAALYWVATDARVPWQDHVLAAVFWPIAFELIRRVFLWRSGFDGLGFGDVKLMAPIALCCGLIGSAQVVLIAAMAALGFVLISSLWRGRAAIHVALPFGPFLCFAAWVVWISTL